MLDIVLLATVWNGVINRFKDPRVDSVVVTPVKVDNTWLEKAKKIANSVALCNFLSSSTVKYAFV